MQPTDKETLLKNTFDFLKGQSMGVIATVAANNTPESACLNYFLDSDWTIYILTHTDSRKVANIKQNPHVAFAVGVATIPNTAQIQADAQIIESSNPDFDPIFQRIKDSKLILRDPIYDTFSNNYVILKLKINWLRWLYFEEGTGKEVYTVLIP